MSELLGAGERVLGQEGQESKGNQTNMQDGNTAEDAKEANGNDRGPEPPSPPADPKLIQLFRDAEAALTPTSIGADRWYIVVIACLVAGPDPEASAHLYTHLCAQAAYTTPASRQRLVRRLREALVKAVSIVGVCKPLEAILAIAAVEQPADRDMSPATRANWQCDEANLERAMAWYDKIYAHNASDTLGLFAAHPDFIWLSKHITYGLYLGDRQVLDDLDTEMVVFPAIMTQNLRLETWWHIRGTRRVGVSQADTQTIWQAIKTISAHFGVALNKVPTVDDVEHDV